MNEIKPIIDWVGGLGGASVLALVVAGLWKGWIILPRERDALKERIAELKAEAQEWKSLALRNSSVAEKATTAANTLVARQSDSTGAV